jgi:hypothetical protein
MQSYAAEAETYLGELQGMDPNSPGNTLMPGSDTPVKVLYGNSRVFFVALPGGGYRKRIETTATMTRAQGLPAPKEMTKIVRTDQTPHVTYVVDAVLTDDPLDFILTLVKHGE